jgi:CheY-like chemotaxis protein
MQAGTCGDKPVQYMTALNGPILLIEDDADDRMFVRNVLQELQVPNPVVEFSSGHQLMDYLLTANTHPLLILSDLKLEDMSGLELREKINDNPVLRRKSVPFIFLSDFATQDNVKQAYSLTVQGFFAKAHSIDELKEDLDLMIRYWKKCLHPNREFRY